VSPILLRCLLWLSPEILKPAHLQKLPPRRSRAPGQGGKPNYAKPSIRLDHISRATRSQITEGEEHQAAGDQGCASDAPPLQESARRLRQPVPDQPNQATQPRRGIWELPDSGPPLYHTSVIIDSMAALGGNDVASCLCDSHAVVGNGKCGKSYRQILVTAGPVRRRRFWVDGQ
jgi:hypothetical protein